MLTPDQKRVKFDPTFLEIVNTSLRHTTQGIQNDFATANIASTFIHSNCPICLKDQLSAIEITQMTCGHYSCNNCMLDYLNKNPRRAHRPRRAPFLPAAPTPGG